jgi:hypothetical protein
MRRIKLQAYRLQLAPASFFGARSPLPRHDRSRQKRRVDAGKGIILFLLLSTPARPRETERVRGERELDATAFGCDCDYNMEREPRESRREKKRMLTDEN